MKPVIRQLALCCWNLDNDFFVYLDLDSPEHWPPRPGQRELVKISLNPPPRTGLEYELGLAAGTGFCCHNITEISNWNIKILMGFLDRDRNYADILPSLLTLNTWFWVSWECSRKVMTQCVWLLRCHSAAGYDQIDQRSVITTRAVKQSIYFYV